MSADYRVEAELIVNGKAAANGLTEVSNRLATIGSTLRGTNSAFGGMVAQAIAFGGAYVGVSAMVGGFRSLVSEAFQFQKEVGSAQLGLQTVMGQVEQIADSAGNLHALGFERANALAADTYAKLQDMAVVSSATSAELLGIYQATYGAARSAGAQMQTVFDLTQNAATAAAALGIDFAQASRDMGAMLRGTAGLDVKLFSSLRSMNAITMDAQKFNKLNPQQRVAVLSNALEGFEAANAAYGRSLPGALSTTQDLFELFRASFFGPAFAMVAEQLNHLNDTLVANKDTIESYLVVYGRHFQEFLARGVESAKRAFTYVSGHWDEILGKVRMAVHLFQEIGPKVLAWGETFVKMRLAAWALGVAFQAGSWIPAAMSALTSSAATLAEMGVIAGGGGAAAGAGAAAGGAAAGGTMAAVGAAMSALAWPLTALAAAVASVWVAFQDFPILGERLKEGWDMIVAAGGDLVAGFSGIWDFLRPIFSTLGSVLGGALVGAFKILAGLLRVVVIAFRIVGEMLGWLGRNVLAPVGEKIGYALSMMLSAFGEVGTWLSKLVDKIKDWLGLTPGSHHDFQGLGTTAREVAWEQEVRAFEATGAIPGTNNTPTARTTVHNDFRGSNITIEQSFREADPDRVALRMIEDIQRFAEQRVQSGYAPALTR